jgi:hypothetical protein
MLETIATGEESATLRYAYRTAAISPTGHGAIRCCGPYFLMSMLDVAVGHAQKGVL